MSVSVTQPLDPAFRRVGRMLFKPFEIKKWFVLGFAAWLSQLGEGGGGGGNFNIPTGGGGGPRPAPMPVPPAPAPPGGGFPAPGTGANTPTFPTRQQPTPGEEFFEFLAQAKQFFFTHAWWIIPVFILALLLGVALMWIRSRGKFVFLDGVARDQAEIAEPWRRLARQGNSFFKFELLLSVLGLLWFIAIAAVAFTLALGDLKANQISGAGVAAIVLGALGVLFGAIVFGVTKVIAEDFVMPIMYVRDATIGPAWGEFRAAVLPGHVATFVLYILMKILLSIGAGVAMMFATCITCFLAALPYLGTVLMLPIFVFFRSYSLYFLRQFSGEYNVLVERMPEMISAFPVVMPPGTPTPGGPVPMTPPPPPMPPGYRPPPPPVR